MSEPAVSVIIPTRNRADLLREALDSVAGQSFRDYEVIVVDDGSTEDIAQAAVGHPTRPAVIRQAWKGPAAARNRGLDAARGATVAFLDSDDLWLPSKLERFVRALDADAGVRIFYGPMRPIDQCGQVVSGRTKPCHRGWITEQLFCSSFVHVPTVVCSKELLVRAGGFDESLPVCEDYDLWLRLSIEQPFGLIDEPLALRRLHGERLSKQSMSRNLAVKAEVLRRFLESDKANGRLRRDVAKARLARVCFAAARAAFRNSEYQRAVAWCRDSRQCGHSALRTIPLAICSMAFSCLAGGRTRDNESHPQQASPV